MSIIMSPTQQSCLGIRYFQMLLLFMAVFIGIGFKMSVIQETTFFLLNIQQVDFMEVYVRNLAIFYWTCTLTQVLIGYLARSYEGSILNGIMRCGALFIILMHIFVRYIGTISGYIICSIIGLIHVTIPICVHGLLAVWAPPFERAQSGAFVYGGESFGKMINMSTVISISTAIFFYASIIIIFIWSLIYSFFGSNIPAKHRCISQKEKEYIEESLRAECDTEISHQTSMSLKNILKSPPIWAIIIAHCCQSWLELILMIIPAIQIYRGNTNIATWEPYLIMWFFSLFMGWASDYSVRNGASTAKVRKICNTLGFWGPAAVLVLLNIVGVEMWNIIVIVIRGFNAASVCGFQINHIDLSPKYASFLMSLSSLFASIVNLVLFYTFTNSIIYQWHNLIYITIGILVVGNLIFIVFGKAKVQYWNN